MLLRTSFHRVVAMAMVAALAPIAAVAADDAAAKAPPLTAEQSAFFEAKVRPLLVKSCFQCHSAESGKTKGGLSLDTRDRLLKGGNTGAAIVPGQPEQSLLIKAISYVDQDLQMPPKEKLSAEQVADLTAWVKMGAPDPRTTAGPVKLSGLTDKARAHYAYHQPKPYEEPAVKNKAWVATPVDQFILAKIEAAGLQPNHPAPRDVLIRRASYDLIGLPPTPEEVQAFMKDPSPTPVAFAKVVDRLLASPHYGERWGRFWLDSARYADTTGNIDTRNADYRYTNAWTYRDWVIKAFNEDMPYDQFLKEQIAADLLPGSESKPDDQAALGFLTVGKRFQNNNDTIDERIDTVSKATMAITVSCARCHDHKFDPIPTADYYSLHGIFASLVEPETKPLVGKQPSPQQVADYNAKRKLIEDRDREAYFNYVDEINTDFRKKAAGYVLTSLYSYGRFRDPAKKVAAVKEFSLDSTANGQRLNGAKVSHRDDPIFTPLVWFASLPADSFQQGAADVLARIAKGGDGHVKLNPLVVDAFKGVSASELKNVHDVAMVYGKLFASIDAKGKELVRARRAAKTTEVNDASDPVAQLAQVPLAIDPAPLITTEHLKANVNKLLAGEGAYNLFLFAGLNDLDLTHPGSPSRAMIVVDSPSPKDSPVFIRGDANVKGKLVPRQFLEILAGPQRKPFAKGSGRLELAEAIANKNNPLTARAMVNRIWMHHFGVGFVRTPDDLGVQSEAPSHPELFDYLACRFMYEGWSIKKMHRMIMLSNTYQQSSDTNPFYAQKEPENRLLWRANLRRLDFEAIRDSMLQFSGKIDRTVGGRPVNLTDEPYSYRRSIYGFIDRGNVPELLAQFDFGDPNRPNSARTSTIVPQQALFFMNSPMSVDVARKVCSRPEFLQATNDYGRVRAIYEVIYQREPRGVEMKLAASFYNAHAGNTPAMIAANAPAAGPAPGSGQKSARYGGGMAVAGGGAKPTMEKTPQMEDMMTTMMKGGSDKRAIHNEGEAVARRSLSIWEQYAQALLLTNEVVYVH